MLMVLHRSETLNFLVLFEGQERSHSTADALTGIVE